MMKSIPKQFSAGSELHQLAEQSNTKSVQEVQSESRASCNFSGSSRTSDQSSPNFREILLVYTGTLPSQNPKQPALCKTSGDKHHFFPF